VNRAETNVPVSMAWKPCLWTVAAAAFLLLVRKSDALLNPQFWAEDGTVFFLQQYEEGSLALLQPYAGYLHLVPRLTAWFADVLLPYSALPFAYNYTSLLLTLLVVASVYSPRFQADYKPLLALALVVVPHNTEVFLNITNIQWIFFFLLFIVLMKVNPSRDYGAISSQYLLDLLIVVVCGLTGPFLVFLAPFFTWKWLKDRNRYNACILAAVMVVALVQLGFLGRHWLEQSTASVPNPAHGRLEKELLQRQTSETPSMFDTYVTIGSVVLGHRTMGPLFFGENHLRWIWKGRYYLSALYFGFLIALLAASRAGKRTALVPYCVGVQFILLLAVMLKFKASPLDLFMFENGPRYFYIPFVLLAWALIALIGSAAAWVRYATRAALFLAVVSSLTSHFQGAPFVDYQWSYRCQSIGVKDVVIPLNPNGWKMTVKAKPHPGESDRK